MLAGGAVAASAAARTRRPYAILLVRRQDARQLAEIHTFNHAMPARDLGKNGTDTLDLKQAWQPVLIAVTF